MPNHILLVDGPNLFMRVFYRKGCVEAEDAFPFVLQALKGAVREWSASHLVVALDSARCFRYDYFGEYKAKRNYGTGPSPAYISGVMRPLLESHGVCFALSNGYEADDVIATIATRATNQEAHVSVLSTDKDLFALVDDGWVRCLYPEGGREAIVRHADVVQRLGVEPWQVPELKLLAGDKSDNIPKVGEVKDTTAGPRRYGFSEERAAELLRKYGFIDEILAHIDELPDKEQAWLAWGQDQIELLRPVVELVNHVPLLDLDPHKSAVTHLR